MKVLFLILKEHRPSSRIRVLTLLPLLRERGLEVDYRVIPKAPSDQTSFIRTLPEDADLIVVQKKVFPVRLLKELKRKSGKLVYDIDDAIYVSPNSGVVGRIKKKVKFKKSLRMYDAVIAANHELLSEIKKVFPAVKIKIIPSAVEGKNIPIKKIFELNKLPRVVWLGTSKNFRYLREFAEVFKRVHAEIPIELVIISDKTFSLEGLPIHSVSWDLEGQYEEAVKCDVAIMPLTNDPFTRGKASYKLLQYMSCGVPAVASDVGMNREVSQNEKNCLLAKNKNEFYEKLIFLLKDKTCRELLSKAGRVFVEGNYTQEIIAQKLSAFLQEMVFEESVRTEP